MYSLKCRVSEVVLLVHSADLKLNKGTIFIPHPGRVNTRNNINRANGRKDFLNVTS